MVENTEKTFSSVVSINPYNNSYTKSVSSFLKYDDSVEFEKDQNSISFINTKEFITAQVEISRNIPQEDLYDAITNKAYDDLALDQAVPYIIQYTEIHNFLDESSRKFNVFVVDPEILKSRFEVSSEKIKYIDTIIPVPLLLKSLYTRDILSSYDAHAFVYLQKTSAFIAIYDEKEYVFSKAIEFSFEQMYEEFCELYGEKIEYNDFYNFFTTEDLKYSNSPYKEFLIKLYKNLFANINDILTYVKRAYDINKIEQIYIGTEVHIDSKLHEIAEVELNIKSSLFEFDYGFESTDTYVDQLHSLMHLYAILPNEEKYICNFTTYQRPPRFTQRHSGRLILLAAATSVLAFIYPVTYWSLSYAQSLHKDILTKEYNQVHIQKVTTEATIKNKKLDLEKAKKLLAQEEKDYTEKKNTLNKIHQVKVDYLMKAKNIATLTKSLNKYNVGLESLDFSEKDNKNLFTLKLVANKSAYITKLISHLTKSYEGKYNFSLQKIYFDLNEKKYLSELKVEIL